MIYGFSVGFIAVAMPRLMEETVPNYLIGFFGSLYCLSFAIATLVAYLMAYFLPPESDPEALVQSKVTQFIFALPIFFYILQLLLQFTYFKRDSVKFLVL